MKILIKKIIIFLSLSFLVIIALALISSETIKSRADLKIPKKNTTIVVGHSHSQCSVNDSILSNTSNLSSSGESYFYNFQKLKQIINENSQIKTVLIEFTNNNVDSIMDEWTWGYEKMSFYLQYYSPYIGSEDFNLLMDNNPTDLFTSYSIATRKNLYRILRSDYNLIDDFGGYTESKLSKVDDLIAEKDFNSSISKNHVVSNVNLKYLRKMIDECRKNNVDIFLIRSPQHELYADLSNESVYQKVLKTQFNDVELLDFDNMKFPNKYYLDLHHLNYKGSLQFSKLLNELIENNILTTDNKQEMIDKAILNFNLKQVKPNF